ncbi:MAG: hypothetical protein IMY79_02950 [Chloroflexi bacterium]|nr:hypothetical protein [Chloroflexota bacterium]
MLQAILSKLEKVAGPDAQGWYTALCPYHDDRDHPNLRIDPKGGFFCNACGEKGTLAKLAQKLGVLVSEFKETPMDEKDEKLTQGLTLDHYAEAKKLPRNFLVDILGLRERHDQYGKRIAIPYMNEDGEEVAIRYRHSWTGDRRFSWRKGDKPLPYGLQRLRTAREKGFIILVEGESDAQTLWHQDLPALGIPGSSAWKDEWTSYLDGISIIYALKELDKGGDAFIARLGSSLKEKLRVVTLDGVKDISELYLKNGDEFKENLGIALTRADVYEPTPSMTVSPEVTAKVEELLKAPDLIQRFLDITSHLGIVGEETNRIILFLACISRIMPNPLALTIKGESSSGKNALLNSVVKLFPPEAVRSWSRLTPQAFFYMKDKNLEHCILTIVEAAGAEEAGYPIRLMLSEKGLVLGLPVRNPKTNEMRTEDIEVKGPVAFIQTTTKIILQAENETRYFSLWTDASPELTSKFLDRLAYEYSQPPQVVDETELEVWREAMRQIEYIPVLVPYAPEILKRLSPDKVRVRRDAQRFMALIQTIALLHQHQRKRIMRNGQESLEASIEDYGLALWVAEHVLSESLKEIPQRLEKLFNTIRDSMKDESKEQFTRKDVEHWSKLERRTANDYLNDLARLGYLEILESGKGKATVYGLLTTSLSDTKLPRPEEIMQKSTGADPPSPAPPTPTAEAEGISEKGLAIANSPTLPTPVTPEVGELGETALPPTPPDIKSKLSEGVGEAGEDSDIRLPDGRKLNWNWCLSAWESLGRPPVPLRPWETIVDLQKFLSSKPARPEDLPQVAKWLYERMIVDK